MIISHHNLTAFFNDQTMTICFDHKIELIRNQHQTNIFTINDNPFRKNDNRHRHHPAQFGYIVHQNRKLLMQLIIRNFIPKRVIKILPLVNFAQGQSQRHEITIFTCIIDLSISSQESEVANFRIDFP